MSSIVENATVGYPVGYREFITMVKCFKRMELKHGGKIGLKRAKVRMNCIQLVPFAHVPMYGRSAWISAVLDEMLSQGMLTQGKNPNDLYSKAILLNRTQHPIWDTTSTTKSDGELAAGWGSFKMLELDGTATLTTTMEKLKLVTEIESFTTVNGRQYTMAPGKVVGTVSIKRVL